MHQALGSLYGILAAVFAGAGLYLLWFSTNVVAFLVVAVFILGAAVCVRSAREEFRRSKVSHPAQNSN